MKPMDVRPKVDKAIAGLANPGRLDRIILTPVLCRAARAGLGWCDFDLADASGVEVDDIRDLERGEPNLHRGDRFRLWKALQVAGARCSQRGRPSNIAFSPTVPDPVHSADWDLWGEA